MILDEAHLIDAEALTDIRLLISSALDDAPPLKVVQAGGSEKLIDPAAKNLIHDYSGGVPRQINNLATACLLQAAAQNATRVSEAILPQTLSEFQLP